jgi:predicted permease
MDDELQFHLERRIEDLVRGGMARGDAARRARIEFGNPEAYQDRCREARGLGIVDALRIDLRFAWRSIRKNPLLSTTVVATLALGIGANTAMFSVLYSVLNPVAYPQADRLVFLHCRATTSDHTTRTMAWSYPKFADLTGSLTTLESLAAVGGADVNLTSGGDAERLRGEIVSPNYFAVLGIGPLLGTLQLPDGPDASAAVVLAESLWRRRFSGNSAILGTSMNLNGTPFTIVGVAPDWFIGETGRAELWLPLAMTPAVSPNPTRLRERMAHWLVAVGRLRPGVSIERVTEDVKLAVGRMEASQPSAGGRAKLTWDGFATPLVESKIDPGVRRSLMILLAAVACVLLIASLNITSMLFGRAVVRRREVAIRLAIGATRGKLIRQFLTESLLLAAIGGVLGFALAGVGLRLLTTLGFALPAMPGAPFVRNVDLGLVSTGVPAVVAYAALVALFAALIFGLVPAVQASKVGVSEALKGDGAGWVSMRQQAGAPTTVRGGLLTVQIALAVTLLAGAGLMIRTFERLLSTRIGVSHDNVLTFRLELPASQYSPERGAQVLEALIESFRQLPGVHSASVTNGLPLQGQAERTSATIDGVTQSEQAGIHMVGPGFFDALRLPLIRGRLLTDQDRAGSRRVALVSEAAARSYAPDGDIIGRRLALGLNGWGAPNEAEIVGVVGDVKYQLLTMPFVPEVYLSYQQRVPLRAAFVLRTDLDPLSLVPAIRQRVTALEPTLPVHAVRSLSDVVASATVGTRFVSMLLTVFSVLALLLACVGVYGALAYSVTSRTREIGVRMALGAEPGQVARQVQRQVLVIGIAGLAGGFLGARLASSAISGFLYQVQPGDPMTLLAVALILMVSIALAGFLPARRASRISPIVALRED